MERFGVRELSSRVELCAGLLLEEASRAIALTGVFGDDGVSPSEGDAAKRDGGWPAPLNAAHNPLIATIDKNAPTDSVFTWPPFADSLHPA